MSEINIVVRGGVVQEVWSTNRTDTVNILDWDEIEADKEECKRSKDIEKMFRREMKNDYLIY